MKELVALLATVTAPGILPAEIADSIVDLNESMMG